MAKLPEGILGPVSGTIGSIVGAKWRGVYYIRSKGKKRKKIRSKKQLASQAKFKFLQEFLKPFRPYFIVGFQNDAIYCSEWNAAFSANYKAVTDKSPDFGMDFEMVKLSSGLQPGLRNPNIRYSARNKVEMTWTFQDEPMVTHDDQIIMVIYCAEMNKAQGSIGGVSRADEKFVFKLNPRIAGKELDIFIYASSLNRKLISPTHYLGKLIYAATTKP